MTKENRYKEIMKQLNYKPIGSVLLRLCGVVKSFFTDLNIEVKRFYWNSFLTESERRFKNKPKTLDVARRLHRYKMYLLMK